MTPRRTIRQTDCPVIVESKKTTKAKTGRPTTRRNNKDLGELLEKCSRNRSRSERVIA